MQNLILVFAAFCLAERGIYSQKLRESWSRGGWGSKRSPNWLQLAAELRLGPQFCGTGVARWPHQEGGASWGEGLLAYLVDFLVSSSTTDWISIWFSWLRFLDSRRDFLNSLIAQISSLRVYSELIQNKVGFWACSSFISLSIWAYI